MPLKRAEGVIREEATATSVASGNDHDGSRHQPAPIQPRDRPQALREVCDEGVF